MSFDASRGSPASTCRFWETPNANAAENVRQKNRSAGKVLSDVGSRRHRGRRFFPPTPPPIPRNVLLFPPGEDDDKDVPPKRRFIAKYNNTRRISYFEPPPASRWWEVLNKRARAPICNARFRISVRTQV